MTRIRGKTLILITSREVDIWLYVSLTKYLPSNQYINKRFVLIFYTYLLLIINYAHTTRISLSVKVLIIVCFKKQSDKVQFNWKQIICMQIQYMKLFYIHVYNTPMKYFRGI